MTERIAYFDCPAGIAGDMTLGALLDAGADLAVLHAAVEAMGLDGEVTVRTRHEERGHLGGQRVEVECAEGPPRAVPELLATVTQSRLPDRVRRRALDALRRIGDVEAAVHGLPVEKVHLHELGGADALVDLVGSFWLLETLDVGQVYASPLPAPRAPFSAPATLRILAGSDAVLVPDERSRELVTPTGAVLLVTLARFERPAMRLERVGYGLGGRQDPGNAVGLWLGSPVREAATVEVIEANLDDMAPNQLAAVTEDLLAAGALDVTLTPLLMKKGRPGHLLTVLAAPQQTRELAAFVLRATTTLGVRVTRADRHVAGRRVIEVSTPWGVVRVKVKELEGRAVDVAPEYEDCRRLGGDVREVMRHAAEAARREVGL
ncbi:MAG: nickel pincer cofactor biosynthesis protein LarC [Candidatus Dormibacteraeota bacterium]|nr:nickel pincer cofactor biosynthesis protein LarC [Candidatus Dormibacteraeota bacterium]MBO0761944.1 nickel pincer cofactor biosynthesis protein LarC [Candidatus Dormibacteraeota bacterium]